MRTFFMFIIFSIGSVTLVEGLSAPFCLQGHSLTRVAFLEVGAVFFIVRT